jgi:hypothetical protein
VHLNISDLPHTGSTATRSLASRIPLLRIYRCNDWRRLEEDQLPMCRAGRTEITASLENAQIMAAQGFTRELELDDFR